MSPLFWFTVTFSVTFITLQSTIYVAADTEILSFLENSKNDELKNEKSAEEVDELPKSLGEFLAGEETPVWIAYSSGSKVTYQRQSKYRVKEAIDYWRLNQRKTPHSGNDKSNSQESESDAGRFYTIPLEDPVQVKHLSILVVMDYRNTRVTTEMDKEKLINERILYALALWGGVQFRLHHVNNGKIQLSISGIVIGMDEAATPYVSSTGSLIGLKMDKVHSSMLKYWRQQAEDNEDFPLSGYHIVATMTRLGAVKRTAACKICPAESRYVMTRNVDLIGRKWSPRSLTEISEHLTYHGWCMAKPRQFQSPGKPIEPILPGVLMPMSEQCEARGWKGGMVCKEKSSCGELSCRKSYLPCTETGPAEDGTYCGDGKMCLDGKCLSAGSA